MNPNLWFNQRKTNEIRRKEKEKVNDEDRTSLVLMESDLWKEQLKVSEVIWRWREREKMCHTQGTDEEQ